MFRIKLCVREYLARAVEAILDLDRLLHKVNDAIPGVASKLLLVAHEALETERAIQGAVQEEEVGGVVAQVAVEVVGFIPGLELLDRLVVELALEGPPQHPEVEPVLVVPHPPQEASVEGAMGLAEETRADLRWRDRTAPRADDCMLTSVQDVLLEKPVISEAQNPNSGRRPEFAKIFGSEAPKTDKMRSDPTGTGATGRHARRTWRVAPAQKGTILQSEAFDCGASA